MNSTQNNHPENQLFKNAPRAKNWGSLKPVNKLILFIFGVLTLIIFYDVINWFIRFLMSNINSILLHLPYLQPLQIFYRDPSNVINFISLLFLIFFPQFLRWILRHFYKLNDLSLEEVEQNYPETFRLIQRFCKSQSLPVSKFAILPSSAPIIFSYGNLKTHAEIVVSKGLLSQVTDEELAVLYACELSHIDNLTFVLTSLFIAVLQVPYLIYIKAADFGHKAAKFSQESGNKFKRFLWSFSWLLAVIITNVSYGSYWLLKLPTLWFNQMRFFYSDRSSSEITGNPNALIRALLKITIGMSNYIKNKEETGHFLESFELGLPVGYRQAIAWGNLYTEVPISDLLKWDCLYEYRLFLNINYPQTILGDRLSKLCSYAKYWLLTPELDLPTTKPPLGVFKEWFLLILNNEQGLPIFPSALIYGIINGTALRVMLWSLGKIADWLNIWQLIWLHQKPLLFSCIFITFSLSLILEINNYFPDIKPNLSLSKSELQELLINPKLSPAQSQIVTFTGKLLGRKGLGNWLGQDLILDTEIGLIKLHFFSSLGIVGNLFLGKIKPHELIGRNITVKGWLHRGVTLWIDVDTLRTQQGKIIYANYPIWVTIVAISSALYGAYLIWL
jgi:Zn-dependent protease with chaperone function